MARLLVCITAILLVDTLSAQPYELEAGVLEYQAGSIIASGGVTGRFDQAEIRADRLRGNTQTGDLQLEGDVFFQRDDLIWFGDQLQYNYITQVGLWEPIRLQMDALILHADSMRRTADERYEVEGMKLTSCREEEPLYHLYAPQATLEGDEVVEAHNVWIKWKNVPVFYLPYWRQSLRSSRYYLRGGYRSNLGLFGTVGAQGHVGEQIQTESFLHYYSRRGLGLESHLYGADERSSWRWQGFYLSDRSPYERYDKPDDNRRFHKTAG